MQVRSLFISDTHLGLDLANHPQLLDLISNTDCEFLFIVGDFVDGWKLKRKWYWHKNYNTIIQKILRLSRKGTKVIYLWGNHDDFLSSFENNYGENFTICRDYIHTTIKGEKILILHGDQFDGIIARFKFIQIIGSIIYDYSLYLNKIFRVFKFSLSNFLKQKAKEAIKYINDYENAASNYAKQNNCNSIMVGHIHKAQIKTINGINYYNTGDWVESNTFIVEKINGDIKLYKYEDFSGYTM